MSAVVFAVSVAFYWWTRNGGGFTGPDLVFASETVFSWGKWQLPFVLGLLTGWHWHAVQRVARSWAAKPVVALAVFTMLCLTVWSQEWRLGVLPASDFWFGLVWFWKYTFEPALVPFTAAVAVSSYWLVGLAYRRGRGPVLAALETIGCRPLFAYLTLVVTESVAHSFVDEMTFELGRVLLPLIIAVAWCGGRSKQRKRNRQPSAVARTVEAFDQDADLFDSHDEADFDEVVARFWAQVAENAELGARAGNR
jgi:hypothetical protein